jgi:plastocyanin/mono/diheme cytochrome c family protein
MRRAFILGVLTAIVVAAVVAAATIASGVVDVAATRTHRAVDRVLAYASTRSIAHHARNERNPLAGDPGAVKKGLDHYRDDCLGCHGGPGAHPADFAAGLHPRPPDLASPAVQSAFTDGMLYAAVSEGIDSTGMPAFRSTHSPEDIWAIVAFLRHLPSLTPVERRQLGREGAHEHEPAPGAAAPPAQGEHATSGAPGQHVHTIRITGFEFVPATAEVNAGDVVEWKNEDVVAHTATSIDHAFDTGEIDGGDSKRVTVRSKGRLAYSCRYHPEMKGTLDAR